MNIDLFLVVVFWACFSAFIADETLQNSIGKAQTELSFNRTSGPIGTQIVTTFKVSVFELHSMITWVHAEKQCNNSGGHLISIANHYENDLIYSMISTSEHDCWIGLFNIGGLDSSSNTDTNNWRWIDGTHFSYGNWDIYDGQPDNWEGHESCGKIYGPKRGEGTSSRWDDIYCKSNFTCFICGNVIAIEPVIATTTIIPTTSTTTPALTTSSTTTTSKAITSTVATASTSTTTTIIPTTSSTIALITDSTRITTSTTPPPIGSTLLTTEASIAIIILACIFSLTTVCLIVILFVANRKHARALIIVRQQLINNIIARTAGRDANGLELQSTNANTYYDTQNGEAEGRYEEVLNTMDQQ